uniref:Granzyme B-like n=1 Tax=Marmota marmota marmota TaxID=9994 RepID=A0A8C5ZH56_MARMA
MKPLLLLLVFLLCPRTEAGKIIGGQEAVPHSHPYMAFLHIQTPNKTKGCGGFLVREDFVLTAAHCWGRTITVILGAHDIDEQETTQQVIPIRRAIPHPNFKRKPFNDIMLLQLKNKAKLNAEVSLLKLPSRNSQVTPGMVCTLAGWGHIGQNISTTKLHEVQLEIQKDEECLSHFKSIYDSTTQICVGNPKEKKNCLQVSSPALASPCLGTAEFEENQGKGNYLCLYVLSLSPIQSLVLETHFPLVTS